MSEVQDAIQILYLTGQISGAAAQMVYKILNTVYLSKWKGKTSFSRLRQIKGEEALFLNAATEDRLALRRIEQEMKAHGILFARLPDLCGGDGRTQYVISPSDLPKFKIFLLDHQAGPYGSISVGLIRPSDYIKSGVDPKGNPTPGLTAQAAFADQRQKRLLQKHPNPKLLPEAPFLPPETIEKGERNDPSATCHYIQDIPMAQHSRWRMYRLDPPHALLLPRLPGEKESPRNEKRREVIYDQEHYCVLNLKNGSYWLETGEKVYRRHLQAKVEKQYADYLAWNEPRIRRPPARGKKPEKRR